MLVKWRVSGRATAVWLAPRLRTRRLAATRMSSTLIWIMLATIRREGRGSGSEIVPVETMKKIRLILNP